GANRQRSERAQEQHLGEGIMRHLPFRDRGREREGDRRRQHEGDAERHMIAARAGGGDGQRRVGHYAEEVSRGQERAIDLARQNAGGQGKSELRARRPRIAARAAPGQHHSNVVAAEPSYGSSETIFMNSSAGQTRAVRPRTWPPMPLASANLAILSPFAVSTKSTRSDSPEVRYTCLISQPHFLARSRAACARLG